MYKKGDGRGILNRVLSQVLIIKKERSAMQMQNNEATSQKNRNRNEEGKKTTKR
jgi:hypothetical protein